jgi:protocatechuate 3,4-dioxygenase beta subunit
LSVAPRIEWRGLKEVLSRPWIRVLLVAAALLLAPLVAWFAFPSAPSFELTPAASAHGRAEPAPVGDDPFGAGTDPHPVATNRAAAEPPTTPVTGVVVDGNGRAVEGAHVECEGKPHLSATTDASGRFELPPEADGCSATAVAADGTPLPATVVRAGDKNRLEVASPGSIAGIVVDEIGNPIDRYTVAVETYSQPDGSRGSGPTVRRDVSDKLGAFELTGLAPGHYVLVATAKGKAPAQSERIEVESGRRTGGVRITLTKGATVSGVVTDRESRRPIAGATVRLDGVTGTGTGARTTTDDAGRYTIDGTPTGAFSLRFSHTEYRERIEPLDARGQKTVTANVDLAPRGDGPSSEWTGIGATLAQGGKFVEVVSLFDGGPAATAGVKVGDRIVAVEGEDMEGATVGQCVTKLRGPEGSRVRVTLGRDGSNVELTITRAKITR